MIFKRCFGIGQGIGFTKSQCEEMWSNIKLSDHVQIVYENSPHQDSDVDSNGPVNVVAPAPVQTTPAPANVVPAPVQVG